MNSTTVIANYTPTSIPAEGWAKVADFVRDNVAQVLPADSTPDVTRRYLRALAGLAYEQHVIGGRDLTVADLLADHVIEAYVVTNLTGHSNHVRGATRGALRTLGRELNPDWEGDNGATKFGSDSVTEPYNETELDDVREFPNVQTNAERRQKAETILALGLGAGLRGGEIETLQACDVIADQHGVVVRPSGYRGAAPRNVPVLSEWANAVAEAAERARELAGEQGFVFAPKRSVASSGVLRIFMRRAHHPGIQVSTQALRATWVVDHLSYGVPEGLLCAAAGLTSLRGYVEYRRDPDPLAVREVLSRKARTVVPLRAL